MPSSSSNALRPPRLDLRPDHEALVLAILQRHVPRQEVWAFGSRIQGKARPTSDLDLAVITEEPLAFGVLERLREAFAESNLPMKVDVLDWSDISEEFRGVILPQKIVVQKAG